MTIPVPQILMIILMSLAAAFIWFRACKANKWDENAILFVSVFTFMAAIAFTALLGWGGFWDPLVIVSPTE